MKICLFSDLQFTSVTFVNRNGITNHALEFGLEGLNLFYLKYVQKGRIIFMKILQFGEFYDII